MDLFILSQKLNRLIKNKIVNSTDDLFVINNFRSMINNLEAVASILDSDISEEDYITTLQLKLSEFTETFVDIVINKVEEMGFDVSSSEDDYIPNQNIIQEKSETPTFKTLNDVMKEIALASRNFNKGKKSNISIKVQHGKDFEKKNKNFLNPNIVNTNSQMEKQENETSIKVEQPQSNKPSSLDEPLEIQNNNVSSESGNNEDYLNLGNKKESSNSRMGSVGRDYIYNLLKSKGK